jgi:CPA2 family monovalent cation:H+ antiporter-2
MWASIAAVLTILGNLASGYFASKFSKMKTQATFDIGFTLAARGEFSIIMANIGKAGGLNPIIQSFVVVYVLILSIIAPILTKESRTLWKLSFGRNEKAPLKPAPAVKRLSDLDQEQ